MNKHILYLNYILYIYMSDKFIWRKLRANMLTAVLIYNYSSYLYLWKVHNENKENHYFYIRPPFCLRVDEENKTRYIPC